MQTVHATALEARVAAQNRANRIANELSPKLLAVFAPFVGKKIRTAQGDFTRAVAKALDPVLDSFQESNTVRISRSFYTYSLHFEIRCNEQYNRNTDYPSTMYAQSGVSIGELSGGDLTELAEAQTERPTDYSAAAVLELRRIADETAKVARAAESACCPFGLYDR